MTLIDKIQKIKPVCWFSRVIQSIQFVLDFFDFLSGNRFVHSFCRICCLSSGTRAKPSPHSEHLKQIMPADFRIGFKQNFLCFFTSLLATMTSLHSLHWNPYCRICSGMTCKLYVRMLTNVFSQCAHAYGRWPKCVRICIPRKSANDGNFFLHKQHSWTFLHRNSCFLLNLMCENCFLQKSHFNKPIFECDRMCICKLHFIIYFRGHRWHLNLASPV